MANRDEVETALLEMIGEHRDANALMKAVRQRYPKLKKKDIIRAAFGAIISVADRDSKKALELQEFALRSRGGDDA